MTSSDSALTEGKGIATPPAIPKERAARPRRAKAKRLQQYRRDKPAQLSLFELLGPQDRDYSHTIEVYDFMPKYFWGKSQHLRRQNGKFLDVERRQFECRGQSYNITIKPARIEGSDGVHRDCFPSKREELVEDALRKFASEGSGAFLDDQAGVMFTLYQLQQELKLRGHTYSKEQLKDALYILSETHLELSTPDEKMVIKGNLFQTLGLGEDSQEPGEEGRRTKAFVRFHPLVTAAIKSMKFRQVDYAKVMSFTSVIARQLHKRISHHYTQAGQESQPYTIMLSTIMRDFGLTEYAQRRDNLREVVKALEEMKEKDVILEYTVEKRLDAQHRNKLVDAKFTIQTTPTFNEEMIKANHRKRERALPARLMPPANPFQTAS
jgi:hypothetical protein